jgi:hypothetical protein
MDNPLTEQAGIKHRRARAGLLLGLRVAVRAFVRVSSAVRRLGRCCTRSVLAVFTARAALRGPGACCFADSCIPGISCRWAAFLQRLCESCTSRRAGAAVAGGGAHLRTCGWGSSVPGPAGATAGNRVGGSASRGARRSRVSASRRGAASPPPGQMRSAGRDWRRLNLSVAAASWGAGARRQSRLQPVRGCRRPVRGRLWSARSHALAPTPSRASARSASVPSSGSPVHAREDGATGEASIGTAVTAVWIPARGNEDGRASVTFPERCSTPFHLSWRTLCFETDAGGRANGMGI